MVFLRNLIVVFFLTGCSFLTGPEGIFPEKQYEFLDEEIAEDINLPEDIKLSGVDNHYPVTLEENEELFESIPKPRQIFSAGGASEVQFGRAAMGLCRNPSINHLANHKKLLGNL